jgi:hypothetical protein
MRRSVLALAILGCSCRGTQSEPESSPRIEPSTAAVAEAPPLPAVQPKAPDVQPRAVPVPVAPPEPAQIETFVPREQEPPTLRAVGSGDELDIEADRLPAVTADGTRFAALVRKDYMWMDHEEGGLENESEAQRLLVLVDAATGKPVETITLHRDPLGASAAKRTKARAAVKRNVAKANERLAKHRWLELVEGEISLPRVGLVVRGHGGDLRLTQETPGDQSVPKWPSDLADETQTSFYTDFKHCRALAIAETETGNSVWWEIDTFDVPAESIVDYASTMQSCKSP